MGFTQGYSITYSMEQFDKKGNLKTTINTYLDGNQFNSIYEEDFKNSKSKGNEENLTLSYNENSIYFKDFKQKLLFYNDYIYFKNFEIQDNIELKKWEISTEKKYILGYECQKATCQFRGRIFIVFFTKEVSVSNGPWKLDGLPGLILEAYSDDAIASFKIIAQNINLNKDNKNLKKCI